MTDTVRTWRNWLVGAERLLEEEERLSEERVAELFPEQLLDLALETDHRGSEGGLGTVHRIADPHRDGAIALPLGQRTTGAGESRRVVRLDTQGDS